MSDHGIDEEVAAGPSRRATQPAPRVRTARKTSTMVSARQPSTRGSDVIDRIAHSLDPQRQAQRNAEQSSTLFQSQQLILLQSQIRDLNQTIQTLRDQVTDSERRRVDADRRADQLQNQMYITYALRQAQQPPAVTNPPYRESATRAVPTESPQHPRGTQKPTMGSSLP